MRRRTESQLLQAMACLLFGAKPLPKPLSTFYQLAKYDFNDEIALELIFNANVYFIRYFYWKRSC